MEYLVTAEEMKQYDANTMDIIGIPGMVLMERAALGAFSLIEEKVCSGEICPERGGSGKLDHRETCHGNKVACDRSSVKVLILCGTGNNGGDGLALARLLSEAGYRVWVHCEGDPERASEQWRQQKKILEHFPVGTSARIGEREYTIMVDALFGVGLSRRIEGSYARAVADFNRAEAFKLALDMPSGIHSDTAAVLGCAVEADVTVTFGFCKRGLTLHPGSRYAGEVVTVPIGITEKSFLGREPELFFYDEEAAELLPRRDRNGNKGTFGKVLLIAGAPRMAGAALLAAKAAYRIGAGMVKVLSHADNRLLFQSSLPEVLFGTAEDWEESRDWANVIAIGPGLGRDEQALRLLEAVICDSRLPLLIDADGLNLLAEHRRLLSELAKQGGEGRQIVLTPHVGELSRLTGRPVGELKENLLLYAKELSEQIGAVVAAKDARTFICRTKGSSCVNLRGNSGMATAGSGDVLSGIIAGLLAQGREAFAAAATGVCIHAAAGDKAAQKTGEHACMAGDIINELCFL